MGKHRDEQGRIIADDRDELEALKAMDCKAVLRSELESGNDTANGGNEVVEAFRKRRLARERGIDPDMVAPCPVGGKNASERAQTTRGGQTFAMAFDTIRRGITKLERLLKEGQPVSTVRAFGDTLTAAMKEWERRLNEAIQAELFGEVSGDHPVRSYVRAIRTARKNIHQLIQNYSN